MLNMCYSERAEFLTEIFSIEEFDKLFRAKEELIKELNIPVMT